MRLIFLDAKSDLALVDHSHLMRRLYHYGVQDRHRSLISDMHKNASSIVKWTEETSDPLDASRCVRQDGILSTGLYKVHINPALDRLQNSNLGTKIDTVYCGTTACADDLTIGSKKPCEGQTMVSRTLPGTVARSEASSLGMQAAPSSIPTSGTFFRGDLVMKTFLRPCSLFR